MNPIKVIKSKKPQKSNNIVAEFSNIEIVTLAVYLLGGNSNYMDTEDIAVKVNELAPGRFNWKKYPDQINIDNVRKRLSDAKNPTKGGFIIGSFKEGWTLNEKGLSFCKDRMKIFKKSDISRPPLDYKQIKWNKREKTRMINSAAFKKALSNNGDEISSQEAEAFFRLDEYIIGKAREKKINRYINAFANDQQIGETVKKLLKKVRENAK
jgi:hypothetical protein